VIPPPVTFTGLVSWSGCAIAGDSNTDSAQAAMNLGEKLDIIIPDAKSAKGNSTSRQYPEECEFRQLPLRN
jgi:hypothetical protein